MEMPGVEVLTAALESLGLNPREISAYQTSLSLGPKPASVIAKVSGLNRAHTYEVLTSLKSKGLVEEVTKNSVKHFSSIPPEAVLKQLDTKTTELASTKRRRSDASANGSNAKWRSGCGSRWD